MDHIQNHLKNSRRVLLVSHVNPDGDAIGSLIAMGLALEAMGHSVTLANDSPIPAVYRFLPAVHRITDRIDGEQPYDTAMVLDCGDLKRVGDRLMSAIDQIPVIINVDHHITNTGFGHLQQVEPFACATAEIVYRLIRSFEVPMSRSIATAIYTGILTDTGSFRFANTNRAAFRICEEMVALGSIRPRWPSMFTALTPWEGSNCSTWPWIPSKFQPMASYRSCASPRECLRKPEPNPRMPTV